MENLRHFFGLKKDPFSQNVAVRDLYPLPALAPLKQRVSFAVQQKALTVITGDVGAGKSTSLRYMAHQFQTSEYQIISLIGGQYSLMELYRQILLSFGIEFSSYQITFMIKMIREKIQEIASRNVTPIMIIDEAHLFKHNVFSQLHTLLQFEYDSKPVMPVVLCGQDGLMDHLMTSAARPLASRVLGKNHLESIKREVMEEYLNHHLALAGLKKPIFAENAVYAIHQKSGGILRRANSLAKAAMLVAAMERKDFVSAEHVRVAATELIL
ncbi:MAG: AAA family ATPase [Candidatus Sedimenticola sp. 6PFRAG7]